MYIAEIIQTNVKIWHDVSEILTWQNNTGYFSHTMLVKEEKMACSNYWGVSNSKHVIGEKAKCGSWTVFCLVGPCTRVM